MKVDNGPKMLKKKKKSKQNLKILKDNTEMQSEMINELGHVTNINPNI